MILQAITVGLLNGLRGSGFLKLKDWHDPTKFPANYQRYDAWLKRRIAPIPLGFLQTFAELVQWSLKRIWLPALIGYFVWALSGSLALSLVVLVPYLLKIYTGTGGDMQVRDDNVQCSTSNTREFKPYDRISEYLANRTEGILPYPNYCQRWGFFYTLLWGFTYSLPFIFTNYLVALPLLAYPLFVRYLNWRLVEILYLGLYVYLFLYSI
jgi:hypothetical protein